MILVVDRGNSLIKIALFRGNDLLDIRVMASVSANQLNELLNEFEKQYKGEGIVHGIYSSVTDNDNDLIGCISSRMNLVIMSENCPLPVTNSYTSLETLGNDRIAAAVGASFLYPASNVLCIDAGTCITYDLLTAENEYLGGGISPGIQMRFKALHTFTAKLPLVSHNGESELIGRTTSNSIRSGILNGTTKEIDGIIDMYTEAFSNLKIILTGGDAKYFDKKLKNNIFATPNLVLLGLKYILQYNVEK